MTKQACVDRRRSPLLSVPSNNSRYTRHLASLGGSLPPNPKGVAWEKVARTRAPRPHVDRGHITTERDSQEEGQSCNEA